MCDEDALYRKRFTIHGGDFDTAGEVSTQIKSILKSAGLASDVIRRATIASFEAEINVVIHAESGHLEFLLTPTTIHLIVEDKGPGIENVELAMKEGFSTASDEMREKGFGAGMGLPNIKRSVDDMNIQTEVGVGTTLRLAIRHGQ